MTVLVSMNINTIGSYDNTRYYTFIYFKYLKKYIFSLTCIYIYIYIYIKILDRVVYMNRVSLF